MEVVRLCDCRESGGMCPIIKASARTHLFGTIRQDNNPGTMDVDAGGPSVPRNGNLKAEANRERRDAQLDTCPIPDPVAKAMAEKTGFLFCPRCHMPCGQADQCPNCKARLCAGCGE
jgi:hypothetical protein